MVSPKARKRPAWVGDMAICASGAHRSSHHIPWNFLALGETIVRTHLNLLPSIQQPLEQIAISAVKSIGSACLGR
jgi:hypothetical protein